jgi:hypothetical protein
LEKRKRIGSVMVPPTAGIRGVLVVTTTTTAAMMTMMIANE